MPEGASIVPACSHLDCLPIPNAARQHHHIAIVVMDKYTFPNDPVADPAAVVAGDQFRFTLISYTVLRYEWAVDGVFEDRPSTFAINRRFPVPKSSVVDRGDDQIEIITASFHVTYNKKRFSRHGLVVSFSNKNT